ncbi:Leiomodin-1 [Entophlyctis luteolus]|nr:Leiomodin-1 [Entophlyctis luteolus]
MPSFTVESVEGGILEEEVPETIIQTVATPIEPVVTPFATVETTIVAVEQKDASALTLPDTESVQDVVSTKILDINSLIVESSAADVAVDGETQFETQKAVIKDMAAEVIEEARTSEMGQIAMAVEVGSFRHKSANIPFQDLNIVTNSEEDLVKQGKVGNVEHIIPSDEVKGILLIFSGADADDGISESMTTTVIEEIVSAIPDDVAANFFGSSEGSVEEIVISETIVLEATIGEMVTETIVEENVIVESCEQSHIPSNFRNPVAAAELNEIAVSIDDSVAEKTLESEVGLSAGVPVSDEVALIEETVLRSTEVAESIEDKSVETEFAVDTIDAPVVTSAIEPAPDADTAVETVIESAVEVQFEEGTVVEVTAGDVAVKVTEEAGESTESIAAAYVSDNSKELVEPEGVVAEDAVAIDIVVADTEETVQETVETVQIMTDISVAEAAETNFVLAEAAVDIVKVNVYADEAKGATGETTIEVVTTEVVVEEVTEAIEESVVNAKTEEGVVTETQVLEEKIEIVVTEEITAEMTVTEVKDAAADTVEISLNENAVEEVFLTQTKETVVEVKVEETATEEVATEVSVKRAQEVVETAVYEIVPDVYATTVNELKEGTNVEIGVIEEISVEVQETTEVISETEEVAALSGLKEEIEENLAQNIATEDVGVSRVEGEDIVGTVETSVGEAIVINPVAEAKKSIEETGIESAAMEIALSEVSITDSQEPFAGEENVVEFSFLQSKEFVPDSAIETVTETVVTEESDADVSVYGTKQLVEETSVETAETVMTDSIAVDAKEVIDLMSVTAGVVNVATEDVIATKQVQEAEAVVISDVASLVFDHTIEMVPSEEITADAAVTEVAKEGTVVEVASADVAVKATEEAEESTETIVAAYVFDDMNDVVELESVVAEDAVANDILATNTQDTVQVSVETAKIIADGVVPEFEETAQGSLPVPVNLAVMAQEIEEKAVAEVITTEVVPSEEVVEELVEEGVETARTELVIAEAQEVVQETITTVTAEEITDEAAAKIKEFDDETAKNVVSEEVLEAVSVLETTIVTEESAGEGGASGDVAVETSVTEAQQIGEAVEEVAPGGSVVEVKDVSQGEILAEKVAAEIAVPETRQVTMAVETPAGEEVSVDLSVSEVTEIVELVVAETVLTDEVEVEVSVTEANDTIIEETTAEDIVSVNEVKSTVVETTEDTLDTEEVAAEVTQIEVVEEDETVVTEKVATEHLMKAPEKDTAVDVNASESNGLSSETEITQDQEVVEVASVVGEVITDSDVSETKEKIEEYVENFTTEEGAVVLSMTEGKGVIEGNEVAAVDGTEAVVTTVSTEVAEISNDPAEVVVEAAVSTEGIQREHVQVVLSETAITDTIVEEITPESAVAYETLTSDVVEGSSITEVVTVDAVVGRVVVADADDLAKTSESLVVFEPAEGILHAVPNVKSQDIEIDEIDLTKTVESNQTAQTSATTLSSNAVEHATTSVKKETFSTVSVRKVIKPASKTNTEAAPAIKPKISVSEVQRLVQSVVDNKETLIELDLQDCQTLTQSLGITLANGLVNNTYLKKLNLTNTKLNTLAAVEIGKALETNSALEVLYLERNLIGPAGIKAIALGITDNKTLRELKLANQALSAGVDAEQTLARAFGKNYQITKITMTIRDVSSRGIVDRAISRNNEVLRLQQLKPLTETSMTSEVLRLHAQLLQLQHTEESLASAPLNLGPESADVGSGLLTNAEVEAWRQSAAVVDDCITSPKHDGMTLDEYESNDGLLRMQSQRRATTVWDEDDVEQLRIAHALAKHASELFPNNVELKQKELLAQSSLSKVIRKSYAESTVSTVNVKSLVGNWEQRQKSPVLSPARMDLAASRTSRRLSIKQNILLKKTLHSFRNTDTDAIKPEDFTSMASKILNEGNDDNSDLTSLGNSADQEEAFINAYFEELEGPASVTVVAVPNDPPFQKPPTPANPTTMVPVTVTKVSAPIYTDNANASKPFIDIHEHPGSSTTEEPKTPIYDVSKSGVRDRRQTAKHLSAIRKRASAMPASRLLKELDTVMSDIQQFGGVDLYSDDEVEEDRHESQDWGDEGSGNDWYKPTLRKSEENDPESAISQHKPEHPPHLMKYRERASLYTASDMNQLGHEDLAVIDQDDEEEFLPDMSSFSNIPQLGLISPAGKLPIFESGLQLTPTLPVDTEQMRAVSPLSTNTVESAASNKAQVVVRNETIRRAFIPTVEAVTENEPQPPADALRAKSPSFFQRVFRSKSPISVATGSIRRLSAKNSVTLLAKPSMGRLANPEERTLSQTRPVSNQTISRTRTVTSPSIYTRTVTSPSHYMNTNVGSSSTLLNSEDDPDAISGELRLHTNKLFNPWQDIVLVLSPRRRGIYYVKTGKFSKGFAKSEQVVGFIELNSLSSVESIGHEDRGVSSTVKGKPTFRVVKVNELGDGAVKKEYFYFCAKSAEDRDMWVDSLLGFLNDLKDFDFVGYPNPNTSSIYTSRNSVRGITPSGINGGSVASLHSPEELSLQLLKQQKLLLQQRALMAAVAQQLHVQQEITAELQAAKISQHRMSVTSSELSPNPQLISNGAIGTPVTASSRKGSTAVLSVLPKTAGAERALSRNESHDHSNAAQSTVSRKGSFRQEGKQFEGQIPLASDYNWPQNSVPKMNEQVTGASLISRTLSDGGLQTYSHLAAKRPTTPSSAVSYNGRGPVTSKSMRPASPPPEKRTFFERFKSTNK